jgi:hypothetical protein
MNLQKNINGFDLTLGGDTQFIPQITARGWNGESRMSISLPDDKNHLATITDRADIITYDQADFSCKWYPRGQQGFEWEYILQKKPEKNLITFDIALDNVIPFFQPELTKKEIDEGCYRPPQTVGSYALYHPTGRWNHYKGGRFGRILRPRVISNNAKEVWADLKITKEQLLITVPQDFLDSAEYPIMVDPTATFGSGDLDGDGSYSSMGAGYLRGQKLTSPADTLTAVSFTAWLYSPPASGTRYAKAVLVGSDKNIVANGVGAYMYSTSTGQPRTSSFATPPTLVPNSDYYICIVTDNSFVYFYYDSVESTYFYDNSNSYSSPTDPTDGTEAADRYYEIYCTYNQAAGGATLPPKMDHYRRMRGN